MRELEKLSAELSETTDTLGEMIAEFESGLANAKVSVSVWIEEAIATTYNGTWRLGYARIGKSWRIAVERQSVSGQVSEPVPLQDASRLIRAKAALLFGVLLERLTERTREFLEETRLAVQATGELPW